MRHISRDRLQRAAKSSRFVAMYGIKDLMRDFTRNHAALDPTADDPLLHPALIELSPDRVADHIESWAQRAPRWSLVSRQPTDDGMEVHLTRTTRVFRFKDDIHISLNSDGPEKTFVEASSQSRVGKGDLGQNPRNLKELTRMLRDL